MNPRTVTSSVLAGCSLLLLYFSYLVIRPFFSELFLALILTIVVYPAYEWVVTKTRRPILSAWICTLAAALLLLLPLSALSLKFIREMSTFIAGLSTAVGQAGTLAWFDHALEFASAQIGLDPVKFKSFLQERLSGLSSNLIANAVKSIQGAGSWLFSSVITLVTMFFLFSGGSKLLQHCKSWIPLPAKMIDSLLAETRQLMFANVYAVLAVALAQGALTTIGFWFCGLPSPILWGSVAAFFSVVPVVGAAIVWLPAVLYLASAGDFTMAGILLVWGILVISMADNVVRPIVLSEGSEMHTGVMFFALLGGIDAFGVIGVFAGPIVVAMAISFLKLFRESCLELGIKSEEESPVP